MSTFLATQDMRVQQHFEVFEIDLPVITGACTIGSSPGFGTPLTCDQAWTGEYKTYYFTNENAPILPSVNGEPIHRCITSIRETATELKPGDGLSARGSLSITFADFNKQDPNMGAPGVTNAVKMQGDYFAKLDARQIFENKKVRLKLYRVQPDGTVDLVNGAQTRNYIANAFKLNPSTGKWSLACKDVLSLANLDEKTWPITAGGFLRLDIDATTTTLPVDGDTDYSAAQFIRIGDEHLQIVSVADNLTPAAELTVTTRGGDLFAPTSAVLLTVTTASTHSAGDEVFICDLADNETIDSFITKVLVASDFDVSLIPAAEWAAEVAEWHANDKINTLHGESEDVNDVLNRVLTGFLMDLWFEPISSTGFELGKAKLSAISVWKQSTSTLTEGREINAYSINKTPKESIRATRALVVYDKRNLADNDDAPSYKKASQFSDNTLISPALFSKHKDKKIKANFLLNKDSADLLTQRCVSRFKFTPFVRDFVTEERFLNFRTGLVNDLQTTVDQGPDGLPSGNIRAQITKINPIYGKDGRTYNVSTMTYEAAFNSGSEIVFDSPLGSVNLYILAGAPSQDVELTFVFDGTYSNGDTAIRAGGFTSGSKVIIIMVNGFDGQANGGTGGKGQSISKGEFTPLQITAAAQAGLPGGVVYDAQGIDTDIYFSGATPSAAYPFADGYIRAPSGGDGGFNHTTSGPLFISGRGGDGNDGRAAGVGGIYGDAGDITEEGSTGSNGEIDGSGSGWGNVGANNDATGGAAGSGILDSGATTINLFSSGDLATRYINGNGDHP